MLCEGQNDKVFLHETLTYKLNVDPTHIKTYQEARSLKRDIRSNRWKRISILETGGFPQLIKIAVRLTRQFWYLRTSLSMWVIADSDKGPVFNKLVEYMDEYLKTQCKRHNVNPQFIWCESKQKIIVSFRDERKIAIWVLEIPESLETKVSRALKSKYASLRSINTDDETIRAASNLLGINRKEVIRRSVRLLENERWFSDFCSKLERNINHR